MSIRLFKYLSPFLIYAGAVLAFRSTGFIIWLPLIYAWIAIPVVEFFIHPDPTNLSETEEEIVKKNKWYDLLLYMVIPCQYLALALFFYSVTTQEQATIDIIGKTMVMGLLCGVFGINVGHELGHRVKPFEKMLAKMLLLSSLYMHFYIEHNKGHHKKVATPEDAGSARFGESVYAFWYRSIVFGYLSAWHIANREVKRKGHAAFSLYNEMLQYHIVQAAFVLIIFLLFGSFAMTLFLLAALQGILLLETVNYIEHYGLQRRQIHSGRYERAMPGHSWNSDHVIGRLMLFELSRHSDHHYLASRKYQVLRHHDDAPQMPTGYPGMMLLALVPPAWFHVMNNRIKNMGKDRKYTGLHKKNPAIGGAP